MGLDGQTAIVAAKLALREAKSTEMVRALATHEQSALLRVGPRGNRWRDLAEFEERLVELEQRRVALQEEIAALNLQLADEPDRHPAALADWMQAGEEGDRPGSRIVELEAALADRRAEFEACGRIYDETLRERAEHVARRLRPATSAEPRKRSRRRSAACR